MIAANYLLTKEVVNDVENCCPNTLEDCVAAASELTFNEEGYVVVDGNWNRVKIKSPAYVAVHHLKGNDELNIKSVIDMMKANETDEFLSYFPEYKDAFKSIRERIEIFIFLLERELDEIQYKTYETQKDFALAVKDKPFSGYYFLWRKTGIKPKEWVWGLESNKIKECIK